MSSNGPSLDVVAARAFGAETALDMITARSPSSPNGGKFTRTFSWNDKDQLRNTNSRLPDIFSNIFGAADPAQRAEIEQRIARRQSLLDDIKGDYDTLKNKLGGQDRQRVERHLESIFEVERTLAAQFQCTGVDASVLIDGAPADLSQEPDDERWVKAFVELSILAFRCDLCRVSSGLFRRPGGTSQGSFFPWLGIGQGNVESNNEYSGDHHVMSHRPGSERENLVKIERWYLRQYVYFVERLKQEPEGEGSLLDNTLVLQGSDHGESSNHMWDDLPFLLAGNHQGKLRTGRYIDYRSQGSVPHNRLLMSVRDTLGLPQGHFGAQTYGTEGALDLS